MQKGAPCILVQLRKVTNDEPTSFPPGMQGLGKEFSDVFGEVLHGLSPDFNVGHTITLEQGLVPP